VLGCSSNPYPYEDSADEICFMLAEASLESLPKPRNQRQVDRDVS
jgi:hypothetical protein